MSDITTPDIYDDESDSTDYTVDNSSDTSTDTGYDAASSMRFDSDGDGVADTTLIDLDGDGVADAYDTVDPTTGEEIIGIDSDGDGRIDTILEDTDGDGTFDAGYQDANGDGTPDGVFDPSTGEFDTDGTTPNGSDEPFNTNDDNVHGDPMAETEYHQAQAGNNDCLPTSVAMVLTQMTGEDVPASDVVDLANDLDLLGPTGMSIDGGLALLEHWGVDADVETGSLDDLRAMLDADRPVIIGLDADDLYGKGDEPFADDLVSGHAVVITGIDDDAGLVYINDPGFPDGAGVAIPIEQFEDAWTDADHQMIVADNSADDAGDAGNIANDDQADTTVTSSIATTDTSLHTDAMDSADHGVDDTVTSGIGKLADLILLPFNLKISR